MCTFLRLKNRPERISAIKIRLTFEGASMEQCRAFVESVLGCFKRSRCHIPFLVVLDASLPDRLHYAKRKMDILDRIWRLVDNE